MNSRLESLLHRWLPWIAVGGVVLLVIAHLVLEPLHEYYNKNYINPHYYGARVTEELDRNAVRDTLNSTLAEVVQAIPALNGDPRIQAAIASIVAGKDSTYVRELWVTDEAGKIVYFGRQEPISRKLELMVPLPTIVVLDQIPDSLLPASQRLAMMLTSALYSSAGFSARTFRDSAAGMKGNYPPSVGWTSEYAGRLSPPEWAREHAVEWENTTFDPQQPYESTLRALEATVNRKRAAPNQYLALQPIHGGMIAAVGQATVLRKQPVEETEELAKVRVKMGFWQTVFPVGLAAYWFSLPLWVATDARRRQEKAVVWGLFALLGNVMALVLYLLVRREV